ncbi:MAG: hypothetical protein C0469_04240 [Cyanobacteria bacterium DS2.3.42]|nr:hypothetical protein [Cyanobacteria bacterium DS2.3.42]
MDLTKHMKKTLLIAGAAVVCASLLTPALAQNSSYSFHYGNGSARVCNQNQIGLSDPSGTYIGSGTLSQTAQGKQVGGAQANPLLPKVPWGANIQTPGDNFYTPQRIEKKGGAQVPVSKWGANVSQPGDQIRSDLGHAAAQYYVPGTVLQRGGGGYRSGSNGPKLTPYIPGRNGLASYGDDTANGAGSATAGGKY